MRFPSQFRPPGAVEALLFVLVIPPRYIRGVFQNKRAAANIQGGVTLFGWVPCEPDTTKDKAEEIIKHAWGDVVSLRRPSRPI